MELHQVPGGRNGRLWRRYGARIEPEKLAPEIERLLAQADWVERHSGITVAHLEKCNFSDLLRVLKKGIRLTAVPLPFFSFD